MSATDWKAWLEILAEIGRLWPNARETFLATDAAGDYSELDTLRAWFALVKDYPPDALYSAVFRYAETDKRNEWPPAGTTLALIARDVLVEDQAREARDRAKALPEPADDPGSLRRVLERAGVDTLAEYARMRCVERDHYLDWVTDETCALCNGRPPMSAMLAKAADG